MRKPLGLALLAVTLTAACAGPPTQTAAPPTDAPAVAAATDTAAPAVVPATEVTMATVEPTAVVEAAAPTQTKVPRLHLEATDPATVSLAAGQPQLVEFFAFW